MSCFMIKSLSVFCGISCNISLKYQVCCLGKEFIKPYCIFNVIGKVAQGGRYTMTTHVHDISDNSDEEAREQPARVR